MKKYTNKSKNEEAVSPVIGVILMVVITVIIAAIMAVFAFGIGAPDTTPTASVKIVAISVDSENISIQHVGGDALRLSDVKLVIEQTNVAGVLNGRAEYDPVTTNATLKFDAGDRLEFYNRFYNITLNNNNPLSGGIFTGDINIATGNTTTVSVVYRPTDSIIAQPSVDT